MSQPFVGQIVLVGFTFAPQGWALCDGSLLSIADNQGLFQLLGTNFGGDGQTTFGLPDLRGRVVAGVGQGPVLQGYSLGESGGAELVALAPAQHAAHTHQIMGGGAGTTGTPGPGVALGTVGTGTNVYAVSGTAAGLAANAIAPNGASQPHENRQPYQTLNYIISLYGMFPSQN